MADAVVAEGTGLGGGVVGGGHVPVDVIAELQEEVEVLAGGVFDGGERSEVAALVPADPKVESGQAVSIRSSLEPARDAIT